MEPRTVCPWRAIGYHRKSEVTATLFLQQSVIFHWLLFDERLRPRAASPYLPVTIVPCRAGLSWSARSGVAGDRLDRYFELISVPPVIVSCRRMFGLWFRPRRAGDGEPRFRRRCGELESPST